ncbi:hypothetical protein PAMC26510_17515 [Caballeronia sordidicola]|uniref:Uncharacterized protein n=1 Tax=Caballeronia sordidicola TaxID=196367 RepID=A0A242MRX9_CABSO|nr:hypothetical protein PAMC26510_17515 [Caballeronia sordidicola]
MKTVCTGAFTACAARLVHFSTPGVKLREWHAWLAGRGSWHYPIFAVTALESPGKRVRRLHTQPDAHPDCG